MKKLSLIFTIMILALTLSACQREPEEEVPETYDFLSLYPNHRNYYQILVRSFADGNGDGIGDFIGLKEALPHLADLGIEGLWLLPIHPSPSYHGYDVMDFRAINPEYGTMDDFEAFIAEAQRLNIDVVIDYVINHSSDQHPWFQNFKEGIAPYDQFYRRIDNTDPRWNTRGSWGQSIWHSLGDGTAYVGYFGGYMPDLNWSNDALVEEMIDIGLFWLEKGVSGFRLDAALHLLANNEVPPSVPALEETLFMLEYFEFRLKEEFPDTFIVGEIWDAFSIYNMFYRSMDSVFHFDFGHLVVNTINTGFSRNYVDQVVRWHHQAQAIDDVVIEAPFLRNHDQNRLASASSPGSPNLGPNAHPDKLRLAAEMLLTVPGSPFIYYGEELGMKGEASGRAPTWDSTIRLPYLWDDERQPTWTFDRFGFVDTYNVDVPTLPEQQANPLSLFNTYRTLLHLRQAHPALRLGTIEAFEENHAGLQGFYRIFEHSTFQEVILVLHNVSDEALNVAQLPEGDIIYLSAHLEDFPELAQLNQTVDIGPRSTLVIRLSETAMERFFNE